MLSVHKLSVSGALLLSPKSLWIADRRTVTMNQARLRLAIASPGRLQGPFTPEPFAS